MVQTPTSTPRKLSKVEGIKERSNFLLEPVATEIALDTTHFSEDGIQILKFHGSYQQDNRDNRVKGQEKDYQFIYNYAMNDDSILSLKILERDYDHEFRKILRNKMNENKTDFILNKYNFEKHKKYYSYNNICSLLLTENIIHFTKFNKGNYLFCWFGYNLEKAGRYKIVFDLKSNRNLNYYNFIKTHHPVQLYNIGTNRLINEWNYVQVYVNINSPDLLVFIFDDYNDKISLEIRNISIELLD